MGFPYKDKGYPAYRSPGGSRWEIHELSVAIEHALIADPNLHATANRHKAM